MTDPALCADGCGRLATEKRPYADNRRVSPYCSCFDQAAPCGSCCMCLGGCIEQHDEAELWAQRLREMSGQLEPCICWYARKAWVSADDVVTAFQINPACPHHGDARHTCNVAALGRSKHMEGTGWRCPHCGATWVLTRVQGAEQPIRLYPTMQWIRD